MKEKVLAVILLIFIFAGVTVNNQSELVKTIAEMAKVKHEYDKVAFALHEVTEK